MDFDVSTQIAENIATITLAGELDASSAPLFKAEIDEVAAASPKRLVLMMERLSFMASAGLRILIFAKQKLGTQVDIYVVKPQEAIVDTLEKTGFHHSVFVVDQPPA